MDNTNQQVVEPRILSKHFHLPRVFLVLVVALISGGLFGMIGYFLGATNQKANTRISTSYSAPPIKITPQTSPITASAQADTSNWKTYTNKKYGYSFKYPSKWIISGFYNNQDILNDKSNQVDLFSIPFSKSAVRGDYMCVTITSRAGTNALSSSLKGSTLISKLNNGLKIVQVSTDLSNKLTYPSLIVTDNQNIDSVSLANNYYLEATGGYNCIQGDIDYVRLSPQQQVHSLAYEQAIKILKTISLQK